MIVADLPTNHNLVVSPTAPDRQGFRNAVSTIAIRAHESLPQANGRVFRAVKLVLAGDVTLHADGTATVGSQSDGETTYHVNGTCPCPDAQHQAVHGVCKHRIAVAIHRRALAQLAQPTTPALLPVPALPEAPASCNTYVTMAGREVQVTLRDTNEQRLLERLDALLQRFPVAPAVRHGSLLPSDPTECARRAKSQKWLLPDPSGADAPAAESQRRLVESSHRKRLV